MAKRRRAMTPEAASGKKLQGHKNEEIFSDLIGGTVVGGNTEKTDVLDSEGRSYSVKGSQYWQVFLYSRYRLVNNTEFHDMGNIGDLMIGCLDAFPEDYEDYRADKQVAKKRLQPFMRQLKDELHEPDIFPMFLSKAIFNGNEVKYLVILPIELSGEETPVDKKIYHVFSAEDVVRILSKRVSIKNSKARHANQTDDLKVVFRYNNKNMCEFEIRTDSKTHYREAKLRLHGVPTLSILRSVLGSPVTVNSQVLIYGSAIQELKTLIQQLS